MDWLTEKNYLISIFCCTIKILIVHLLKLKTYIMKNLDYLLFNVCILFTIILAFMAYKVIEVLI